MVNVQIREVPTDVHDALTKRADAAGQSLQQFLLAQIRRIAFTPTMDEVLGRIERRPLASLDVDDVVTGLEVDRARR
jgi:hypothetical protein